MMKRIFPCSASRFSRYKNAPDASSSGAFQIQELLLDFFLSGSQQGADGQADTLVLSVHVDDLCLDLLTNSKNVCDVGNSLSGDLGNVDKTVNAGDYLSECAELGDA